MQAIRGKMYISFPFLFDFSLVIHELCSMERVFYDICYGPASFFQQWNPVQSFLKISLVGRKLSPVKLEWNLNLSRRYLWLLQGSKTPPSEVSKKILLLCSVKNIYTQEESFAYADIPQLSPVQCQKCHFLCKLLTSYFGLDLLV